MALVLKDRVKETTTTTGTSSAYALAGAVTGFQSFTSVLSNADTTYYCCTDGTSFEIGLGTFTSSGTTLARTTILESSNSNNAVDWASGTRDIFITQPAEKAVFLNASDNLELSGTAQINGANGVSISTGVVGIKNGGTQSELRLYCESSNAHYAGLKAPAHVDFSDNVTSTLPSVTGNLIGTANADVPATVSSSAEVDHVLVNDGGVLKKSTVGNLGISGGSLTVQDEGSALSTDATTLNFVGAGVAASGTGATKTITIDDNADTVDNKHISVLTQSAYNALTPDSNTIYFITG